MSTNPIPVDDRPLVDRPYNLKDRAIMRTVELECEAIARGSSCPSCGATWQADDLPSGPLQSRSLWHADDCSNLAYRDQAHWTDLFDSYLDVASDLFGDEVIFKPVSTNELVRLATNMWRRDVGLDT